VLFDPVTHGVARHVEHPTPFIRLPGSTVKSLVLTLAAAVGLAQPLTVYSRRRVVDDEEVLARNLVR